MKKAIILTMILLGFTTVGFSLPSSTSTTTTTSSSIDSSHSELDASQQQQERQRSPSSGAINQHTDTPATSGTVLMDKSVSSMSTTITKKISTQDTELIRDIRSRINADATLSTRAKNITIISDNGMVILKGAVADAQEKAKLEEIAKKATGTKSVENFTEVGTY